MTMPPMQKRPGHHVQALEIFADQLRKQKRRQRGDDEGDHDQAERMGDEIAIAAFAAWKGAERI